MGFWSKGWTRRRMVLKRLMRMLKILQLWMLRLIDLVP